MLVVGQKGAVDFNVMAALNPMGLNIKAVSERTGVPLHTLRAWERRYGRRARC